MCSAWRFLLGIGIGGEYPAGSVAVSARIRTPKRATSDRVFRLQRTRRTLKVSRAGQTRYWYTPDDRSVNKKSQQKLFVLGELLVLP